MEKRKKKVSPFMHDKPILNKQIAVMMSVLIPHYKS
jgi:hypothetical protein